MAFEVIYHPLVETDTADIAEYYGEISEDLVEQIEIEAQVAIDYLVKNPLHQQVIYNGVRKMNLHRFPYAVYYVFKNDVIYIMAIMHLRRHPNVWQTRK